MEHAAGPTIQGSRICTHKPTVHIALVVADTITRPNADTASTQTLQ